tara:strand:+ start:342 stop:587 length:246 start_codon:yes stop_codon:yes gene_type:complete
MLDSNDYKSAVFSQNACNLSGLAHSLSNVMKRIREEVVCTDAVNAHPIVRLYVDQMYNLASSLSYSDAYNTCVEKSEDVDS